ncbi:hypothetical protein [Nocardiopsis sp. MG754419]|uniref:hypothetical protein n=1 Tax=Nocardiopsis sp. MG754419 TaxID=2259865 RepID=UPI001BAC28AA|nr:hypothetical protein [Nocardiopsis sp. MG754419]MBR8740984.1 hypothetical protein [Nocardiopsis sp. MG754419]
MTSNTQQSGDELSTLVNKLVAAVEPLKDKFEGSGRNSLNDLHQRAQKVSLLVGTDLGNLHEGQVEMMNAVMQGDQEMSDSTRSQMSAANFDSGKFRA